MTHETERENDPARQESTDSSNDLTSGYQVEDAEPRRWFDVQFSLGTIVFSNGNPRETMASTHWVEVER